MALARNLLLRRLHSLLEPRNAAFIHHIIHSNPLYSHKISASHHRPFAASSQALAKSDRTYTVKSLHSLFQEPLERRSVAEKEKLKGKSKQGEVVGLTEKTGDNGSQVRCVKDGERNKLEKKLVKSRQSKAKSIEEEEVVKGELQGKPKQGEAGGLSEKTEHKKSEVRPVEAKKKKPKKKSKEPRKWKVKFIEEEEEEVVKGEKPEPRRLYDLFGLEENSKEANSRRLSACLVSRWQ